MSSQGHESAPSAPTTFRCTSLDRELTIGALFHNFRRFGVGRRAKQAKVDRLLEILAKGLLAPDHAQDSTKIVSDLNVSYLGTEIPYSSVVFLHRCDSTSVLYLPREPDSVTIFCDHNLPVRTASEMGAYWPQTCNDEVYFLEPIPAAAFRAVMLPAAYLGEAMVAQALQSQNLAVIAQ